MIIEIICIGAIKEKYFKDAILEYQKRLSRFVTFKCTELKEEKIAQNASEKEVEKALEREAENIEKRIAESSKVYSLAIEGKERTSEKFAAQIQEEMTKGYSHITFIIGSSHGLHARIKKRYEIFSFSKMTFPHQLMRVILLEQIYRVFKILNHETYHK